jgi:ParB family chromosome partitioning protein
MSRRLLEKAGLVGLQPTSGAQVLNRSTPPVEAPKPKTAPGTMLGFMSAQSSAVQEAEHLKDRLKEFEGARPVRALDPANIVPSKWANRHPASFDDADFAALKEEIQQAGGNVQPIKVRPVADGRFEIVFGHRRHRASLELGLLVNALVEQVSELELFEQMERENRGRKNLSAWEQGCMYRQAIDLGMFASQRKLSEKLGVDLSMVSKSITLARLPAPVVNAFANPLEIQYRWAQPLSEAVQKDPDGVLARAKEIAARAERLPAAQIVAVLTGAQVLNGSTPLAAEPIQVGKGKAKLATIDTDSKGRAVVRFEAGALPESKRKALAKLIEEFLS